MKVRFILDMDDLFIHNQYVAHHSVKWIEEIDNATSIAIPVEWISENTLPFQHVDGLQFVGSFSLTIEPLTDHRAARYWALIKLLLRYVREEVRSLTSNNQSRR